MYPSSIVTVLSQLIGANCFARVRRTCTWLVSRGTTAISNYQFSILKNTVYISGAHVWRYSRPKVSDTFGQLLFFGGFDSPANVVFHGSPDALYWVQIRRLCWRGPVINSIRFYPLAGTLALVFGVIVHDQSVAVWIRSVDKR